jgi:N-acetylglucosaminyldiphosphoundecaprenol N-acetyl-beta-D-mannosaminyltransferase
MSPEGQKDGRGEERAARRRLQLGRLHIDEVTFAQALDAIAAMVSEGVGGAVFTPNVDHVVLVEHNEAFRRAYEVADLTLADGMPIVWASRLLGSPLPEKISGSDLALPLMERAEREGWRVFLLGGAPGVGSKAAERLVARFPRIAIVGTEAPRIDMSAPAASRVGVTARVRQSKADLVLVALGAPKQELWIAEAAPALRPAVLIGVGASIDFIAGTAKRAPAWMSAQGLEWLYRFAQEPQRLWKRYLLRDPEFLLIVLRELRGKRQDRHHPGTRDRDVR